MGVAGVEPEESLDKQKSGKFLTFNLAEVEFGVEILRVSEIIGMKEITAVPQVPASVLGVLNLRGVILPVIDLRRKFDMEPIEPTNETSIVIVRTDGKLKGLVVDRVLEVAEIPGGEIGKVPSFGEDVDTAFLLGIARREDKVRLLLNLDRVLSTGDTLSLGMLGPGFSAESGGP